MSRKPNVVLIVMDAARKDHLSVYGYPKPTAPCISSIAEKGILFNQAYSTGAWTPPSHSSLFTGLFPAEHGVQNDSLYLKKNIPTLAEILDSEGYSTYGVSCNSVVGSLTGLDRGFSRFIDIWKEFKHTSGLDMLYKGMKRILRRIDRGARRATDTALELISNQDKGQPFFLFLNYMDAHQVCHPAREYYQYIDGGPYRITQIYKFMKAYLNLRWRFHTGNITFSEKDFKAYAWIYDVAVRYIDDQIGRLFEAVSSSGGNDTLFIVTADHGTNLGDFGLIHHEYCLYDPLIRIPLVMNYVKFKPGHTEQPIQLSDLFYLILECCGIDPVLHPVSRPRLELGDIIEYRQKDLTVFAEWKKPTGMLSNLSRYAPDYDFTRFNTGIRAVVRDSMKYLAYTDGREELYNTCEDVFEKNNLIQTDPSGAESMKKLLALTEQNLYRGFTVSAKTSPDVSDDMMSELKSLGYM